MDSAFLANVPLFVSFSAQEREALSENFILREFNDADLLFKQGESAEAMYLIQSGQVSLISGRAQHEQQTVSCGPETLLGEIDLLLNQPYEKTALVDGFAYAWILTRSGMVSMIRAWPEIAPKLSAVLGQPIAITNRRDSGAYTQSDNTTNQIDLSSLPLFANLTAKERADVAKQVQLKLVSANETIFERGTFPDLFYLLMRGQVRLINEHEHVDVVRQGGFFGEMSLLTGQPRQVTAQAIEECDLLLLNRKQFETVTKRYPTISFVLNRTLSARLLRANAQMRPKQTLPEETTQVQFSEHKHEKDGTSSSSSKFWYRVKVALFLIPLMWLAGIVAPTLLLNNATESESIEPNESLQIELTPTSSPTPTPDTTSRGYYDS